MPTNTMILSGPSRGSSMKKILSQNAHFETKSFTELVAEHLIKFEKKLINIRQV